VSSNIIKLSETNTLLFFLPISDRCCCVRIDFNSSHIARRHVGSVMSDV